MDDDLQTLLHDLDARIRELERLPEPAREQAFTVLQLVDRLHRGSVARLAAYLKARGLWEEALRDEALELLLTLYDQVPLDARTRVEDALEAVRPYIESHGGRLELVGVDDGVVRVMLKGSCQSCSASSATLTYGVEAALREGFVGFRELVLVESDEPPHPGWTELPVVPAPVVSAPAAVGAPRGGGPVFEEVARLSGLAPDRATVVDLEQRRVVLVRAGVEAFAFDAACPGCHLPLEGATVSGHVLVCSWTNCAFDIRSGRRVDGDAGAGLKVVPVAVQGDRVLLAMDFSPTARFGES